MADFVAVIRKAVDGLANNTPETRAKVYEKARSAVVRQLENMNPRPPEELLRRQVVKLDAAIAEVEGEYAEALPALEEDDNTVNDDYVAPEEHASGQQVYAQDPADEDEEPAAEERPVEHEEEPAAYAAAPADEHVAEPEPEQVEHAVYEPAPEPVVPTYFQPQVDEPVYAEESRHDAAVEDVSVDVEPVREDETAYQAPVVHAQEPHWVDDGAPAAEDEWRKPADDDVYADDVRIEPEEPALQPLQAARSYPEVVEPVYVAPAVEDERDAEPEVEPEVVVAPAYGAVEPDNRHSFEDESDPFAARADYRDDVFATPAVEQPHKYSAQDEDFSSYFEDASVDLPAAGQQAAAVGAAAVAATTATAQAGRPSVKEVALDFEPAPIDTSKDAVNKERTPWDDLEELIGYDGIGADTKVAGKVGAYEADASGISADGIPAASYMVKKKPRRNYASYVLALLGVLLLAGGGYALWQNRDAMSDMVSGLTQSAQPETAATPEQSANGIAETAETPPATSEPATPPVQQADDGSVQGNKFTQRLLPDGSERDEGPAVSSNGQPATAEGQSVYEQNEAAPAQTPNAAGTPPATQGAAAGAPAAGAPLAAGAERMFLYEEVLGQTVPTAIEGSVNWSLQHEQAEDGKQLATVQGQMSIPARGLSALITFKRNLDTSLPASHLVEIVFSVSPGFEGGAIDSVQRIAMKQTEQDRGNALIAVPAKITDDFHMIALNDFPDAMKTNLELLATRDWIDIPVSYRNGRRALLTMQKGPEGRAAFDAALKDWASVAPVAGQ